MPQLRAGGNLPDVLAKIVEHVAAGELNSSDAGDLAELVGARIAVETSWSIERRLALDERADHTQNNLVDGLRLLLGDHGAADGHDGGDDPVDALG